MNMAHTKDRWIDQLAAGSPRGEEIARMREALVTARKLAGRLGMDDTVVLIASAERCATGETLALLYSALEPAA